MRKRTYRAVAVKQMDMARLGAGHDRLILGCDAAKEVWYGAWELGVGVWELSEAHARVPDVG